MDDTISRKAVLDALNNIEIPRNASWYQYYQQALTAVDKLPPAPTTEVATDNNVATKVGTNLAEVGTDCISRQQAIDEGMSYINGDCFCDKEDFAKYIEFIEQLPPAQPERIRGHWNKKMSIRHINGAVCYIPKWHCPKCDLEYDPYLAQQVNFCYACGQWIEDLVDDVNEVTE